jgi:hypothetical protein
LKYGVSAILTALFLVLAFRGTDFSKIYDSAASANYWWILANFGVLLVSHVIRAWRWRYLLDPIKPNIGLRNLFSGVMVGYMMNNILPRAGEITRPYTIGKLETISKGAAFGTVVVERIMDTLSFLLLIAAIPFLYQGEMSASFPWLAKASMVTALVTLALFLVVVVFMVRRDWTDVMLRYLTKVVPGRMTGRVEHLAHAFLDGFLFLKRPGSFLMITVTSIAIWLLYAVMMYCAFFAFDIQMLGMNGAIVVLAISSIGVALPTPGATGTYHAFTSQALIRLYGVDQAVALSYATVTHAVGFIGVTLVGLYYFVKDNVSVSEAMKNGGSPPL